MPNSNALLKARRKRALAFLKNNQLQQAKTLYAEICRLDKLDVEAWFMQGAVSGQLRAYADAEVCFRQVIILNPHHAEAYTRLGMVQQLLGKPAKAAEYYRKAVKIQPTNVIAHFNLGNVLKDQGKIDEAVACYRKAIQLRPGFFEAQNNLGILLVQQGNTREAIKCFQRVLEINPECVEALNQLAAAHLKYGYPATAVKCYRKLLNIDPYNAITHSDLGYALKLHDMPDEAIGSFQHALRINPDFPEAAAGMARVLEQQGKYQAAYESIRSFLDTSSLNASVAIAFGKVCEKLGRGKEAITLMEQLLKESLLSSATRETLHFTLGRLYDHRAEYNLAFEHVRQANEIEPSSKDMLAHTNQVSLLIKTYTPECLEKSPQAKDRSELPVFIVGMPRSGTSLVEQILACHPKIFGAGELIDIFDMTGSLPALLNTRQSYPECIKQLSQKVVDRLSQRYLDCLKEKAPTAQYVTNKMPANYWHLGFIQLLFPGARIIHCVRAPLDTCLSCYFQNFGSRHIYSKNLMQLAKYSLQYLRIMQHWKNVLQIPVLEVCYEDLVADQETVSRTMIDFCGLEWDAQCLRFFENRRVVNTVSYDQVRRPIYTTSVGRWKNYEAYLGPLIKTLNTSEQNTNKQTGTS